MKKSLEDKKVNRMARRLNKQLREDVFGRRFEVRQYRKSKTSEGIHYYIYQFIDNEQPERNKITHWYSSFDLLIMSPLFLEMNDFIIESDFWSKYRTEKKRII